MGFLLLPPGTPKRPSVGQRLSAGVGKGLEYGQQLMQEHQQQEAYKKLGIPEGTPPDLAKTVLADKLKGDRQTENIKNFSQKFGNIDPKKITDSDILGAEAIQKGMGTQLRNLRNDAIKTEEAEEKSAKENEERIREKNTVKQLLRETGDYDEEEIEDMSQYYDVPTARQLNVQKKEKPVYEPTSQKLAAERTDKFINDAIAKGTAAEEKLRSLEEGMTLHKAGATGFKLMNALAKYFDNPALADPGSKAFDAAMKSQYTGIGDIVKGKVSNFEFATFEKRIATAADSPQAAEALMVSAMMQAKIEAKEKEITERKREEYYNQGVEPPPNFDIQVRQELRPYADLILAQTNKRLLDILNPTQKNNPNREILDQIWQ